MCRWKNRGLWISLFSLLSLILQLYGLFPKLGLTNETFNSVVNAILAFLTAAGIISNPTSGKGYSDKNCND